MHAPQPGHEPMDGLTFAELRVGNRARDEQLWPADRWTAVELGCALAGEVGELCNILAHIRRGDVVDIARLADEVGDVQAFLDKLADRLGIDLGAATRDKFAAVSERWGSDVRL